MRRQGEKGAAEEEEEEEEEEGVVGAADAVRSGRL